MKWLWLWMLIFGYLGWGVAAIIDIVKIIKEWIETNMVEVTDNKTLVPTKKKVFKRRTEWSLWETLNYRMAEYTTTFLWITLIVIFIVSLVYCIASARAEVVK